MTPAEEARVIREAAAILRKYGWRNDAECQEVWDMNTYILQEAP